MFLCPTLPTYFDDAMTIKNNRQVGVNVNMTLVAIFRITDITNINAYDYKLRFLDLNFRTQLIHYS